MKRCMKECVLDLYLALIIEMHKPFLWKTSKYVCQCPKDDCRFSHECLPRAEGPSDMSKFLTMETLASTARRIIE